MVLKESRKKSKSKEKEVKTEQHSRHGYMGTEHSCFVALAGAHSDKVRGVRWLAGSPRVVTFSSEKIGGAGGGGWRNSLLMTDLRTRSSTPFREVLRSLLPDTVSLLPIGALRKSNPCRPLSTPVRRAPPPWVVVGQACAKLVHPSQSRHVPHPGAGRGRGETSLAQSLPVCHLPRF